MFVRTEIESAPVFIRSKIQSATLLYRAIMTLQLFELTSYGFAVISLIKDLSAPNIGRNGNAPPRFAVGSIRFFIAFFLFLRFHAHADLGLGFHHCPEGSCGGSLAQSRIFHSDAS